MGTEHPLGTAQELQSWEVGRPLSTVNFTLLIRKLKNGENGKLYGTYHSLQ